MITDSILLAAILVVVGGDFTANFNSFPSQIAFILLISLLVPALTSAITLAYQRPLVILNSEEWIRFKQSGGENWKLVLLCRLAILLLFPLIPAMMILAGEKAKEERKSLKVSKSQDVAVVTAAIEKCRLVSEFIDETKLGLLTFKRNELSMELIVQLTIHLTMLLLSQTDYPVESGLQTLFSDEEAKGKKSLLVIRK